MKDEEKVNFSISGPHVHVPLPLMVSDEILIKNARVHNLKNLTVAFQRNKLSVVTGVSGSGKSSLVFDTLFAEGQRRYVESLSSYARQFLGRMEKPDVDFIKGIAPAIAIEQKVNIRNPRSTVATSTEIYDYLKLLFARIGKTFHPETGREVKMDTVQEVMTELTKFGENQTVTVLTQIHTSKSFKESLELLSSKGFSRVFKDGEPVRIEDILSQKKIPVKNSGYLLIIDRFVTDPEDEDWSVRAADSIQTAFQEGEGECILLIGEQSISFNNRFEADGMQFEQPSVNFFSFNNPYGACKTCEGHGTIIGIDEKLVIPDIRLSIYEGAVAPWRGEILSRWKTVFLKKASQYKFPVHRPYQELGKEELDYLWKGDEEWAGIDGFFRMLEAETYKIQNRVLLSRYRGKRPCPDCHGTRLRKDASWVRVTDVQYSKLSSQKKFNALSHYPSLPEILLMEVDEATQYFDSLELSIHDEKVATRILQEIRHRLHFLQDAGLGYLSLNRLSNTLSGGESQRINLATSLGSSLVGSMYILDEPSIGLHSRDTGRLIGILQKLRDIGNSVIVVEHDEEIMEIADDLIDIGPEAGSHGGTLVAQGSPKNFLKNKHSLTAAYLSGRESIPVPSSRRTFQRKITIEGARHHNLKNLTVDIPLNVMTVITGVSGSGKSTLIRNIFYPAMLRETEEYVNQEPGIFDGLSGDIKAIQQVQFIDQNPIGKSSRSNPVTYIKAFDAIRDVFANQPLSKNKGLKSAHFSFNVEGGRCDTCQGEGETVVEMQFMADIHLLCEDCQGMRYKNEILEVEYQGKNIGDVLRMTVEEAMDYFSKEKSVISKLQPLMDVGLGYVTLGQSASTLSGGEAQRVKLATFLGKGSNPTHKILFLFDEPSTGLHFHDIKRLLMCFQALIQQGHTVVIIEHHLDIIKCADWIIDLGPEAGKEGGHLVFSGIPEDLVKVKSSYTGQFLKKKL